MPFNATNEDIFVQVALTTYVGFFSSGKTLPFHPTHPPGHLLSGALTTNDEFFLAEKSTLSSHPHGHLLLGALTTYEWMFSSGNIYPSIPPTHLDIFFQERSQLMMDFFLAEKSAVSSYQPGHFRSGSAHN
jgi:hypothetical protein